MQIPVEILILWEQYYKRGDYAAICVSLRKSGIECSPKQLVRYIHNASMPNEALKAFTAYYLERDK